MRILKLVSWGLGAAGVVLLLAGFFLFESTRRFIAGADEAQGTVISLERSRSSSGSGSTYRPVVEFTASTGSRIEFTGGVASNPPSHRVGESVTVLYNPADPQSARIKSFVQLWFGSLLVLALGLLFGAIGFTMIALRARAKQRAEWLRRHGRRMVTSVTGVQLNGKLRVNGRSPYRIVSQATEASSNTVRIYQSENIWFDPSEYLKADTIDVLVDPNNPKRYVMDTSFLPRLEE